MVHTYGTACVPTYEAAAPKVEAVCFICSYYEDIFVVRMYQNITKIYIYIYIFILIYIYILAEHMSAMYM